MYVNDHKMSYAMSNGKKEEKQTEKQKSDMETVGIDVRLSKEGNDMFWVDAKRKKRDFKDFQI